MPRKQWKNMLGSTCNLVFKEKKGRKKAPYSNQLTQEEIDRILDRAVKQTSRYQTMKEAGNFGSGNQKSIQ